MAASDRPIDDLATRLVLIRRLRGMSIVEASAACLRPDGRPLNRGLWWSWECGAMPPLKTRGETLDAIAQGLGVDRHWLEHGGPLARPKAAASRRAA